jgi:hypothetical protein
MQSANADLVLNSDAKYICHERSEGNLFALWDDCEVKDFRLEANNCQGQVATVPV